MIRASRKIQPNKLMGQNFLISRPILKKMIAAAECSPKKTILEIGPGLGALTRELARCAGQVVAVEKDKQLFTVLREELHAGNITNVRLIHGDILKINFGDLELGKYYSVVANIPYYLTSRLIRMLLEHSHPPEEILLMVQKEVAERIVAKPPKINLLALSVQVYGTPEIVFHVPREAFSPRPKVDSAFIRISGIGKKFFASHMEEKNFFIIVRAAFSGKRKTLDNSLAHNLKIPKPSITGILEKLSLSGKRPEALVLDEWKKLTRALANKI